MTNKSLHQQEMDASEDDMRQRVAENKRYAIFQQAQRYSILAQRIFFEEYAGKALTIVEIQRVIDTYGPGDYETYPNLGYSHEVLQQIMDDVEDQTTLTTWRHLDYLNNLKDLRSQRKTLPYANGHMVYMVCKDTEIVHIGIYAGYATGATHRHGVQQKRATQREPLLETINRYGATFLLILDAGLSAEEARALQRKASQHLKRFEKVEVAQEQRG